MKNENLKLDASIFRTYDIRGIVNDTLTEAVVFRIAQVIGSRVREQGEDQVVIARDGRDSGPCLSRALCAGIQASGCNVIDLGMVPTPLLYFATSVFKQHSGVMLTGSHNPADYNGMKIVIAGSTVAEEGIQQIYQDALAQRVSTGDGSYTACAIVDRYIEELKQQVRVTRPLKIVVDAGNGVTGLMVGNLYRALGCEVHELYCDVDGSFPNHHPDPSDPNNMQDLIQTVRETHADVGLSFDGDGDRLGVVTNQGEIIYPDRMLMLFAKAVLAQNKHAKIIYDVKCTDQLAPLIRAYQGEPVMYKTGHALIKRKMLETGALLAGEMSGHFFFKDTWYGFDDALFAGARLLEILAQEQKDCHAMFAAFPNTVSTPELKVFVRDEYKFALMQQLIEAADFTEARDMLTIDGLRISFANGWGLVRPSNTSPYLILRFEAIDGTVLQKIQSYFREWLLAVKPDLALPF